MNSVDFRSPEVEKALNSCGDLFKTHHSLVFFGNRRFNRKPFFRGSLQPRLLDQVHGNHCVERSPKEDFIRPNADAQFTVYANVPLLIRTADCIPLFISQRSSNGAVLAIHAGWRGLAQNIVTQSIKKAFPKTSPQSLSVWVGPHIQNENFFLNEGNCQLLCKGSKLSTKEALQQGLLEKSHQARGQYRIHLRKLLALECQQLGISEISMSHTDTYGSLDHHSHRRYPGNPGRQYSFIMKF